MNDEHRAVLEVIAPTVEEAIEKGLVDLNLPREAVRVEVLDRGNRGLFGIGSRQARVRLIMIGADESGAEDESAPEARAAADLALEEVEQLEADVAGVLPAGERKPAYASDDSVLGIAHEVVSDLLEKMKVTAEVRAYFQESSEHDRRPVVWVEITGKDLSVLIGRRSETLQALQYITALIVGKEIGHAVPLIVDVEGFRSRRQTALRRLAHSMAEQALKTGRRQVLEPMPANERRLVHMELRNHPGVRTESVGEEPNRKITIIPKSQ